MARMNWDRVRKENAVKKYGIEPFYVEHRKRKATQRTKVGPKPKLVGRPRCPAFVKEDNLARHLRKVHGVSGSAQRPAGEPNPPLQLSISNAGKVAPQISLTMLAEELRPRFSDLIVNLARREGPHVFSLEASVTPAIADRVRGHFKRRTV